MDVSREERLRRLRDAAAGWFGPQTTDVERGALIETAFLMAMADGELQEIEHRQLVDTIQFVTSQQHEARAVDALIEQFLAVLREDGWRGRLAAVAHTLTTSEARRRAFRLAAAMSFVDGSVHPAEQNFFGLLAEAFEISDDEASSIMTDVRDRLFAWNDKTERSSGW